ncbi:unnamed protein product, partial [Cylindrotheca closterium]
FVKKSADAEYDFLDFWEANQKFFAMKQGTTENLMHFKERFLRQAEVLQDLYDVAWFRHFAVKTKAYAAIASTDTAAQNKFKDDIFEAVLATGFLFNCDQTRTAPLMLDLQTNYCREVDSYPKTIDQDEIDALLEEAEEFIENYGDEHTKNVEEQTEDRSVASIYEQLRWRNDDDNSDQDPNPNDKYQNDKDLNEKIQEIEKDIQKDKEDVKSLNDEEQIEETRKTYEENDDLIDQIQDEIKECENQVNDIHEFVANLDDNENENDLNEIISMKENSRKRIPKKESKYNLLLQQVGSDKKAEYGRDKATLIARFMQQIKDKVQNEGVSFIQLYYLNMGLKLLREEGNKAVMKELDQSIQRECWEPIHVEDMTDLEKRRAQDAMMLLAEKNTGEIKGRCVYKGDGT